MTRSPRPSRRPRYRCATCQHLETTYAAAERHAHQTGHARIALHPLASTT